MRQIDADEENSPSIRRTIASTNVNLKTKSSRGNSNFFKDEVP